MKRGGFSTQFSTGLLIEHNRPTSQESRLTNLYIRLLNGVSFSKSTDQMDICFFRPQKTRRRRITTLVPEAKKEQAENWPRFGGKKKEIGPQLNSGHVTSVSQSVHPFGLVWKRAFLGFFPPSRWPPKCHNKKQGLTPLFFTFRPSLSFASWLPQLGWMRQLFASPSIRSLSLLSLREREVTDGWTVSRRIFAARRSSKG